MRFQSTNQSSFIQAMQYNEELGVLHLRLNGGWYRYLAVPRSVVLGLLRAESKGQYYNRYIKGIYHTIETLNASNEPNISEAI